jgi:hypothetical protein
LLTVPPWVTPLARTILGKLALSIYICMCRVIALSTELCRPRPGIGTQHRHCMDSTTSEVETKAHRN